MMVEHTGLLKTVMSLIVNKSLCSLTWSKGGRSGIRRKINRVNMMRMENAFFIPGILQHNLYIQQYVNSS